jgi:cell division protein ZapE
MSLITQSIQHLYQSKLDASTLSADPVQFRVIEQLQACLDSLNINRQNSRKKWFRINRASQTPVNQGVYLWGPVGRGKTMLMDMFCQCLDPRLHLRLHFHRFMEMIHQQLYLHSGEPDPLTHIAEELGKQYAVICFDEFFVSDIGDAMLLGRLYRALYNQGTFIISTSNTEPSNLYEDGLHRDRFLPTIKLIIRHMKIIDLDQGTDHRHRELTPNQAYFIQNDNALTQIYHHLSHSTKGSFISPDSVILCNRQLTCKAKTNDLVWFDFDTLCQGARSSRDYIELASRYHHVLLSHVPQFRGIEIEQIKARGTEDGGGKLNTTGLRKVVQNSYDDSARRFISLVDELYDCRVNLFLSAECHMKLLYQGELLAPPFKRTLSRLHEMSSAEYQNTPPLFSSGQMGCSSSQPQTLNLGHGLE